MATKKRPTVEPPARALIRKKGMTANSGSVPGDVFDVRKVRKFIELMNEHDLSEIDLRQGEQRIRLRRGPESVAIPTISGMSVGAAPAAHSTANEPKAAASGSDDTTALFIRSPMVGTYYTAASPDSAPFVKVGDQVGPDTTVCIVEAMKVFNEIPAECSGRIAATLVQNGESVEFGQPLFRLDPNG